MMRSYALSKQALRSLKAIPPKHARQIFDRIEKLANDSSSVPSVQLEGFPRFRRAKSGEYRIIFSVEDEVLRLLVLRIGKRNDGEVYDNLENLA